MRFLITMAAFGTVLSGCAAETAPRRVAVPPPAAAPPVSEATSSLRLRIEPFTDFYFLVRAQAAGVVEPESDFQPIIDAWLPVQQEVGTFGGFWRFDLAGLESTSVEEFREWFAEAPETVPSRAGGTIPIRGPGLAMAAAMEEIWPSFLEQRWPAREQRLRAAVERLERDFMPEHRRALRYMLDSLDIADPEVEVPMSLVIDSQPPGATTYRGRSGPVAMLSVADLLGEGRFSDLEETLLHETCHVLDGASRGDQDAFSVLRRMLVERGLDDSDERLHDIPHLVMFVQAEATMRRLFDANHVAYGDTQRGDIAPFYQRSGEAAVIVRRLWNAYLDGTLSRDQALGKIVDEVLADELVADPETAPTPTDLSRLQGHWEGSGPGGACSVTISGNSLYFTTRPDFWYETTFTLPADTDPQQLHATIVKDSTEQPRDIGTVVVAVFEIEDDKLTLGVLNSFEEAPLSPVAGDWEWVTDRYKLERKSSGS